MLQQVLRLGGRARAIGILRWLTVMPALAGAHAVADPALRARIELHMPVAAAVSMLSPWMLCAGVWLLRRR